MRGNRAEKIKFDFSYDPVKIIKAALARGGDFADLYFEDGRSTSIICEDDRIEKVLAGRDRGCGIRVISNFMTYYAYTNDLTEKGLLEAAGVVSAAVKEGGKIGDIPLLKKVISTDFGIRRSPADVSLKEKIELVDEGNKIARSVDKRISQVKVIYGDAIKEKVVINSVGEWIEETSTSLLYVCQAIASDGGVIQTGYEPVGGAIGLELLYEDTPEAIARMAANRALMMLGARKAPGGRMPVVLSSEAGGTMIHEAVGHGLEADLADEGLSVYSGKIGDKIASDVITVVDDATLPHKRGSFFFDGEGTPAQSTVLVEDGILKGYMNNRLTAMKSGVESTGNGRRESYHHRPIVRMTNTMITPGDTDPGEIVSSLTNGLFVRRMGGGQVNTVTGDFVFEVTEGYLIENGLMGEPVRGATLTGNGPKILQEIDLVGSDLGYGIGTCGKDGQGVPVSDAQPTIRIPEIVVGGDVGSG